jgi:cbb3-type cytochrome oxidase subunit 3
MLLAASVLETGFTAVLAVVALAIWFEWIYRREKRKHDQATRQHSSKPSASEDE